MPDISIQQAYALAFGAYASPEGNSSFTIEGSTNLPVNKTRLTGLLTTPNIDLKQIPATSADTPFNPPSLTFNLATSQTIINETTTGNGSVVVAETGTSDQRSGELSKFLMVFNSNTVSGSLPLDSETVYISSISPSTYSAEVFPSASNITVTSAEGPYQIARLSKSSGSAIQIDILRAKGTDPEFWSINNFGTALVTDGLKISITGSTTNPGFNTIGNPPNNEEFNLEPIKFYPYSGLSSFDETSFYFIGEFVEYNGSYYECIDNTTSAHELPINQDYFIQIDPLIVPFGFQNIISNNISFSNTAVNGNQVFRISIPPAFYAQTVLNTRGRYETNPNWMSIWISLAANTTVIDETTGGGTVGNQCGTLLIKPRNDAYTKGSIWILELSQTTPANNTIINGGNPVLTFTAIQNSTLIFSTITSGGILTPRLAYLNGGDINNSTTLTQTEKNYHRTGIGIVNKLKK